MTKEDYIILKIIVHIKSICNFLKKYIGMIRYQILHELRKLFGTILLFFKQKEESKSL